MGVRYEGKTYYPVLTGFLGEPEIPNWGEYKEKVFPFVDRSRFVWLLPGTIFRTEYIPAEGYESTKRIPEKRREKPFVPGVEIEPANERAFFWPGVVMSGSWNFIAREK